MTATSAPTSWNRLRKKLRDEAAEVPTVPSEVETGYGPVRFAVGSLGEPRLLVPCTSGTRLAEVGAQNLKVVLTRLQLDGASTLFVDITCLNPSLESVFAELTSEVLKRLRAGNPPPVAVAGGIADFRNLLRDGPQATVSDEIMAGLIGELIVLRRLCAKDLNAVKTWTGPISQRHDFRRGAHAIEVKTSMRSDRRTVTVHGIDQLSAPSSGTLTLFHVRMERADSGALSVDKLVAELMSMGVDRTLLFSALRAASCEDPAAPEWNRLTFDLEGMTAYAVTSGFPAITVERFVGGVPPGLSNVRYDVNLDLAKRHLLDEAATEAAIALFLS